MGILIALGILVFVVVVILVANIKIVPQAKAYVVERLGAYRTTWDTGLHILIPVFERIAKHHPTTKFNFGYRRFALLGAFVNAFILLSGSSVVLYESISRISSPEEVNAEGMLWFALLAIAFKGLAVWRTWKGSSVNQRMVSLHLLGDCLGWVAVLVASAVMIFVEIPLLDPILSICISLYILYNVLSNLITAFRIVLEGVPSSVDYEVLRGEVSSLNGIHEVLALRVWSMDNVHHAAEVELSTTMDNFEEVEELKSSLRALLAAHGIVQSTVEVSPSHS